MCLRCYFTPDMDEAEYKKVWSRRHETAEETAKMLEKLEKEGGIKWLRQK
jgi:hypothetical protein